MCLCLDVCVCVCLCVCQHISSAISFQNSNVYTLTYEAKHERPIVGTNGYLCDRATIWPAECTLTLTYEAEHERPIVGVAYTVIGPGTVVGTGRFVLQALLAVPGCAVLHTHSRGQSTCKHGVDRCKVYHVLGTQYASTKNKVTAVHAPVLGRCAPLLGRWLLPCSRRHAKSWASRCRMLFAGRVTSWCILVAAVRMHH